VGTGWETVARASHHPRLAGKPGQGPNPRRKEITSYDNEWGGGACSFQVTGNPIKKKKKRSVIKSGIQITAPKRGAGDNLLQKLIIRNLNFMVIKIEDSLG
jgi:hypothetical protein